VEAVDQPGDLELEAPVGRPLHEARAEVERKGLFLRVLEPDRPVTAEGVFGRVNVVVRNGVVQRVWEG